MSEIQPVSQGHLEEALELLDVPAERQEEARNDLLVLVRTADRHELIPRMREARDDLKRLVKHLDKVLEDLRGLRRDARFDLFYDDEWAGKLGSIDESQAQKVLTHLNHKARAILIDQYGHIKRGKSANAHKRRFVGRGREIFDKWSPIKARRTSGNFVAFLELMYEGATGICALNEPAFFDRSLRDEFDLPPLTGSGC
jgi:hypothetical protein